MLLGHHGTATGQPAAPGGIDQFPRFHAVRIAEGGAARTRTHRLRCLAGYLDLRHPGRDQRSGAWYRAKMDPRDDGPGRQGGVTICECQLRPQQPVAFAGSGDDFGPVQDGRQIAAIGAGIHRHGATDRTGDTG